MSTGRRFTRSTFVVAFAMLAVGSSLHASDEQRVVKISATDSMQFSVKRIDARSGEKLKIVLAAQGSMSKADMAHNWVLLAAGTNVDSFVMSASMARTTDYIPAAKKAQILAATGLAGAGETVIVELAAPTTPGEYTFICTFPGHYAAGMKGKLVVTG